MAYRTPITYLLRTIVNFEIEKLLNAEAICEVIWDVCLLLHEVGTSNEVTEKVPTVVDHCGKKNSVYELTRLRSV